MDSSSFKYPVSKPCLEGNELAYAKEAIESGWISSKGQYVEKFEQEWARYIGTKYAVVCNSGTSALMLALKACGVEEGHEVIVPEFTMVACANAVVWLGAKPVFVDCGLDLNLDVSLLRQAITSKTKAIMPVHIYGRCADMREIKQIADEHGLRLIEDACEAHGATYYGKKVGSIGDIGCFSLFANKIITSGEGGICTTNDPALYQKLVKLRSLYFDKDHTFLHEGLGWNFRFTNVQAAIALGQLELINRFLVDRSQIEKWYRLRLPGLALRRPIGSVLWMYDVVLPKGIDRDKVMEYLASKGIETRYFFKPMSMQPMWFNESYKDTKAYDLSKRGLYLPTYPQLTEEDVDHISRELLGYLKGVCK